MEAMEEPIIDYFFVKEIEKAPVGSKFFVLCYLQLIMDCQSKYLLVEMGHG